MGAIFMSAGALTAIILCIVGFVKLPFDGFKAKYPKSYKATFMALSLILSLAGCIIDQAFILNDKLFNTDFFVLLFTTLAGVLGLYNSYEHFGVKELVKKFLEGLKNLKATAPENKFVKYLDKIDIEQAINLVNAKKEALANQNVEVKNVEAVAVENIAVENQVINAEHIEINNAEIQNAEVNQAPQSPQIQSQQ